MFSSENDIPRDILTIQPTSPISLKARGGIATLTRKLILSNRGDIGGAFAWNLSQLRDVPFSVSPTNGYISPGQDITIEFIFQPHIIRHDIRCDKLECRLEGTKSVYITLSGSCIEVAPARETITITTPV